MSYQAAATPPVAVPTPGIALPAPPGVTTPPLTTTPDYACAQSTLPTTAPRYPYPPPPLPQTHAISAGVAPLPAILPQAYYIPPMHTQPPLPPSTPKDGTYFPYMAAPPPPPSTGPFTHPHYGYDYDYGNGAYDYGNATNKSENSGESSGHQYDTHSYGYGGYESYNYTKRYSSRSRHSYSRPPESFREERSHSYPHSTRSHHDRERDRDSERDSQSDRRKPKPETERDRLLKSWRSHFCETSEDITKKLAELADLDENSTMVWVRSSPADLFYQRTSTMNEVTATSRLEALCKLFDDELLQRADRVRSSLPPYVPPPRKPRRRLCKHKSEACSSSSSDDSSEDEFQIEQDYCMEELSRKLQHPYRIHPDLWHNDLGEMNDGPLCRCSAKSRRIGIRHGIYPGESGYTKCNPNSNNASKLHHYRITISPPTNFFTKTPTMIKHDEHEFIFEGFSLLSHSPLGDLPTCKVIRFNIEYAIMYVPEKMPENFTIREVDLFTQYLFHDLLELVDFSLFANSTNTGDTCPSFHFLPRFVRDLPDNGKEVLAMCEVLKYLLDNAAPLVDRDHLHCLNDIGQQDWQDYVDFIKGMLVTKPGYKPCSIRVDQLDRNVSDLPECVDKEDSVTHPAIVHFGIRPPQLSYAGNPEYQKAWREYVKFRHLMANMSKPVFKDKRKLDEKEARLQEMRTQGRMKRNVTVAVSSKGYYRTGIMCDIVQHAMLVPVLTGHLRFHKSLDKLEETMGYQFKNRYLLQLALTHPSYKENYGTNPDHARNSLTNCGIRQPEYGDRKIHYMNTRKRGINTLINIMSRFGKEYETLSNIAHNERLEFLGDAVVEFLSSIHLFFMFPELEEGGLATYRAAIVQNQHLALLAKKLHLEEYMLYAHGSDLCHELELRHAMANCFEALMGSLLLDGGINVADNVFMNALFLEDDQLREIWKNYPEHPLQEQEPLGDRGCISSYPVLQELLKFEDSVGITFKHIRLLARAFTDRSIGFTHLTLGSNQRLEFLGDTVLQLICSEYLYRHFPEHHEGHLSLLRSSLVNNRTQAVVCDDLGMTKYAVYSNPKAELKTKDRADLLEAFLGALYVDKGLLFCEQFCHVCLFPRLQMFIMNQDWNDPKSKLQQCCLTLRTMDGGEPDIPVYKVIESIGPTNTRLYTVAVYFRTKRLATATGSSIQQAEMNAAKQALDNSRNLFPQLDHQKRVIAKSIKKQSRGEMKPELEKFLKEHNKQKPLPMIEDESHLPKQYRVREDISSDELPEDEGDDEDTDNSKSSVELNGIPNTVALNTSNSEVITIKNGANGLVSSASFDDSTTSSPSSSSSSELDNHAPSTARKRKSKKRPKNASAKKPCEHEPIVSATVEDVSSDEFFNETPDTNTNTVNAPLPEVSEAIDANAIPKSSTNVILTDLKDLVEDVSSDSDLESGELSN